MNCDIPKLLFCCFQGISLIRALTLVVHGCVCTVLTMQELSASVSLTHRMATSAKEFYGVGPPISIKFSEMAYEYYSMYRIGVPFLWRLYDPT
jgi:hypothetical protein